MPGVLGGARMGSHRRGERIRQPPLLSYSTSFPVDENPLSQGGLWLNSDALLTKNKTVGGNAFGTQDGSGAFDDSVGHMAGFGTDYEIEGVVYLAPGTSGTMYREIELWLRTTTDGTLRSTPYGDTHTNGYEINVGYAGDYANVGRYRGAALVTITNQFVPATGDLFRARIEGQRIRAWWNNVLIFDVTDNDAALKQTTGDPGIGFYIGSGGATNTEFGFSAVTITRL